MSQTLLIELLTEELPPKALNLLSNHFAVAIAEGLAKAQLTERADDFTAYATPRRLAVSVPHVRATQNAQHIVKKGPAVNAPEKAVAGFARACGVEISSLKIIHDGKQDIYAHEYTQAGQDLSTLLGDILSAAIKKLPIPKVMRWGSSTHTFVRPVHALTVLHGNAVVPCSVLGLNAGRETLGHRFLSERPIVLKNAEDYAEQLASEGKVIASFEERKSLVQNGLSSFTTKLNATIAADESLLNEVCALVEYPVILEGHFEEYFLSVPQECLILTMQQNQKYFPLLNQNGKLMNRFLLVSNIQTHDPSHIIHGNERVLRARLSDAEFFYHQDQKNSLASRIPALAQVVYHNKIGSQAQRVARLENISAHIAAALNADVALCTRTAHLAKADLLTEMVGEFPELQGVMGKYYAQLDGENPLVAQAIEQHYYPRFAGDMLPETAIGTAVALADKLETLVGIWGIGQIPTGDKDPYALRRAALGVLRIMMNTTLSLKQAIDWAFDSFSTPTFDPKIKNEIADFMQTRLAILLQNDYPQDTVAAVLAHRPDRLNDLIGKLQAVEHFKQLPESKALSAANKRVQNLLKKSESDLGEVNPALLIQDEERTLFQAAQNMQNTISKAMKTQNFTAALTELAGIKAQVDAFFDGVMVMADDNAIKQNRLNLLNLLANLMNAVANIALLNE